MRSDSFGKVTIETPDIKKSKFNLSHDNNTSFDWGSVQPILSRYMMADSTINVNMEQLTRLAPMVVPTFGRVKLKNVVHFVNIKDIFPNWDYFQSKTPINRPAGTSDTQFIPNALPHISSSILSVFCLAGARANVYVSGVLGTTSENEWRCYKNNGSISSPNPATEINALIALGDFLFGNLGGTANLPDWSYDGFVWDLSKFTSVSIGSSTFFPRIGDFLQVPTITTAGSAVLDHAGNIANGFTHSFTRTDNAYGFGSAQYINMKGADVIWESYVDSTLRAANSGSIWEGFTSSFFDGRRVRICFRLSSYGKRLRKVLIGLGYNFSLSDSSEVCILPLLAYYKAWWDSYAPERERNFYQTDAWRLIQLFSDGNVQCDMTQFMTDVNIGGNMRTYFKRFMSELGCLFATERMDAIAAATDKVILGSNNSGNLSYDIISGVLKEYDSVFGTSVHAGIMEPSVEGSVNDKVFGLRQSSSGVNATLQQPQLDALKKAYIYQNKRSVAGMALAAILRANGQGNYVEECAGRFLASSEQSIKISDVVATAATDDAALGQYGGRGLGVSADQFSFNTENAGWLITLSTIVPESGYVNMPDMQNEVVRFEQMYDKNYDGFNYEAVLKKQIVGSPVISVQGDNHANDTMGFLPTYSRFKFVSNKANGDFSLASRKTAMRPFTLDKYIPVDDVSVSQEATDSAGVNAMLVAPRFGYDKLPNAGEDYRYINKEPWNGDFNRIFKAEGDEIDWQYMSDNDNGYLYNSFEYDNFMTHIIFNITYWAHMKAIEESYSTYDEDDNSSRGVISRS